MDNKKPSYYLNLIVTDLEFIIKYTNSLSYEEFMHNELVNSAISMKFIQISENSKKLPLEFIEKYEFIPWNKISGLRNRIVHDYGNIQLDIIYDTATKDIPILLDQINEILDEE